MRRRTFLAAAACLPAVAASATPVDVDPLEHRRRVWSTLSDREKFLVVFGRPDPSREIRPSPYFEVTP